ncbi:drug resistance transporter, EmrB/QacA subfamily [Actinacidiphila yanglinensis]|uniref:Drug resistance transporter, EmrB/QacA subfamily n=1 Tax=Actinacidiphila yanglinensis TaxID=310779 RepID=A0A1H5VTQ3_9ACTN|nr:MDR family MFS transporter [Actinacidiphila yanglinensis]SEF89937.1 drug resistance transporter, EmrB/QacA subfamily [Actinacidiphila yanglinensis]
MSTSTDPVSVPQGDSGTVDPAVWRLAFTIIVGAMAVVFDTTILSVALHDLAADLHASLSTIQWVSTGYLLAMFVTIPLAGWAQARFGGKRLWIAALGVFGLGSVLCALAWNAPSLIGFRVVQGIGGGIMMPLMTTLIMQAAKGRNIGKVMATITLPVALGPILGPVLGGIILGLGDWHWLFLVNIPFCAVGFWLALRNLPDDRPAPGAPRPRLDTVGLLLLSPGAAAVIYGLSQVEGDAGFASTRVLAPLVAGLLLVTAFIRRSWPRAADAIVDLKLFRHRNVSASGVLAFLSGVTLYGAMLLLPLYFQQVEGRDALDAGLLLVPQGVGTLLSRSVAGKYTDTVGPRWVAFAGFTVVALGTVPFAFVTGSTSDILLMAVLFVRGIGMGGATIPLTSAMYVGLKPAEVPHASILQRVVQQLGGSVGTAALAVVLQHALAGARTRADLADGFGTAFWWATAFTAVGIPLTLLLPGRTRTPAAPGGKSADAGNRAAGEGVPAPRP